MNLEDQPEPASRNSSFGLPDSAEGHQIVFETTPHGIVFQDARGAILSANPAAQRILGLSLDQMKGRVSTDTLWQVIREDGSPYPGEAHPAMVALRTGQPTEAVLMGVRSPSAACTRWIQVSATPLRRPGEAAPHGVMATFVDVTERKQAEDELRKSQARLHRAECVAHFGNWEWDLVSGLFSASEGAHQIYGMGGSAWPASEVQKLVLPEYRAELDRAILDLIERGRPYEVEFMIRRHADGEVRAIRSTAEFDPAGRKVFGTIQDITGRKQVEMALRESEFFFKESQRAAAIGSYQCDFRSGLWKSSEVLDGIFGIDERFVRSIAGWMDLVHPEDRQMMEHHLNGEVLGQRTPFNREYRIVRRSDGAVRWVFGRGEVRWDAAGTPITMIGTIQDITERVKADEERRRLHTQLLQVQKMESLGSLAGGVAHDMNNVLGAILGLASANLETQVPGSAARQAFEIIIKAAERGGKMVKSLLSFARQTTAEERELDLNALLQDEVRLLERTTLAKIRIETDLAGDLRPILGDATVLAHAIMNLAVNAVDAMSGGGTLTLRTRNLAGGWTEVQVEDTGAGMAKEVLERAMDPFYTTKEHGKGTGLGLSMVYSAVKAHRGLMEIRSEPGRGTCVRLRFPASECAVPAGVAAGGAPGRSAKGPLEVLVVDDDELIQSSMEMLLQALGHSVAIARSGEEALARVEAGLRPDLVILDMNMPGLGGGGTLPRLRALRPHLPVLLATGRADQTALDLVEADPRTTLLSKPFSLEELRRKMEAALAQSSGANTPKSSTATAPAE